MGYRVQIPLLHILHFVMMDFLFPLLKNSKSGMDDRGHRFGSGSLLMNYPHTVPRGPWVWSLGLLALFFSPHP